MTRKVALPKTEQLIMDVVQMTPEQLEQVIRIAKATLNQKRPRVRKPKVVQKETA